MESAGKVLLRKSQKSWKSTSHFYFAFTSFLRDEKGNEKAFKGHFIAFVTFCFPRSVALLRSALEGNENNFHEIALRSKEQFAMLEEQEILACSHLGGGLGEGPKCNCCNLTT